MSSRPSSPPPPRAQRAIGFQGPFFETETTTPGSGTPKARRFRSQKGGAADFAVTAPVRPIIDSRGGAVLPSRHHGHRVEEHRCKSGEFTSILEGASGEDQNPVSIHPFSSNSQHSAPSSPEMSSSPPPPEVNQASNLHRELLKVPITGTPPLALQRSISPPPFFEMDDRRVGAVLASRHHGHRLEERRSKSGEFASISEGATGEDRRSGSSNPAHAPVTSQYNVALGNNSISLAKRPPVPQKRQTTVGFTARLEAQKPSSPLPARKNGLIASIFKRKKQMETFHGFVEDEAAHSQNKPIINNEPRPTNLGLARIFSYEELIHSTNNFRQELADGGFSRVYLGKLRDERKVAVKVLFEGIPKRMEQFLNEVTVLSRLRHKNLVSLYGCTDPETQKLLLVYEFVPNGTISDHLHRQLPPLTWAVRMQIAIETAEALAYLHSREPPIIHRDVKTSNILLDNEFHVKVADLGMCRLVPWDTSTISTQPQGTLGFRDPESDLYCVLTDKSDVYSFGVVLLELISGQQAVDVNRERNDIYLFNMALRKISNNELENLVDPKLAYHSDSEIRRMVDLMAELACCCLQQEGNSRPPMEEVLTALKVIRDGVQ